MTFAVKLFEPHVKRLTETAYFDYFLKFTLKLTFLKDRSIHFT